MATPKKKVSRSRRNMRRFAAGNKLGKTTVVTNKEGELTRPHRISLSGLYNGQQIITTRKARKAQQAEA